MISVSIFIDVSLMSGLLTSFHCSLSPPIHMDVISLGKLVIHDLLVHQAGGFVAGWNRRLNGCGTSLFHRQWGTANAVLSVI